MTAPLKPGDTYRCPHCHQTHTVEQPYASSTTAEKDHLYVICPQGKFFVGVLKP